MTLKFSRNTLNFVDSLVNCYALYDNLSECYILPLHYLADHDKYKLASFIISDIPELGIEATGPDNARYEKYMFPAMQRHLCDSTNPDYQKEFIIEWNEGIAIYLERIMNELIGESLDVYNQEIAA